MSFGDKIKKLRIQSNLTQEQLAAQLYVSRTAVSKWESDRGYPSIDSLKDISKLFNITVDELLSNEEIIDIAKKENKANIKRLRNSIFGVLDLISIFLMFLPLYPHRIGDFIYSVPLFSANGIGAPLKAWFAVALGALSVIGIIELILCSTQWKKAKSVLQAASFATQALAVIFFALSKQAYLTSLVFVLFAIKITLIFINDTKSIK